MCQVGQVFTYWSLKQAEREKVKVVEMLKLIAGGDMQLDAGIITLISLGPHSVGPQLGSE